MRDRPRLALAATLLVLPALVFDARVVASPTDATYPSLDDGQFATSWAAGAPWPPLADELRTRAGDRPALVVLGEHHPLAVLLLLLDTPSITVVRDDDARAGAARFAVENDEPLPELPGALRRRAVWTYERPRDGDTATLYEIGVEVEGRFHATPEDLRAGLALGDAEFDAFIALFPEIRRWYRGWFGDYG